VVSLIKTEQNFRLSHVLAQAEHGSSIDRNPLGKVCGLPLEGTQILADPQKAHIAHFEVNNPKKSDRQGPHLTSLAKAGMEPSISSVPINCCCVGGLVEHKRDRTPRTAPLLLIRVVSCMEKTLSAPQRISGPSSATTKAKQKCKSQRPHCRRDSFSFKGSTSHLFTSTSGCP
jgi:hypothetical protein